MPTLGAAPPPLHAMAIDDSVPLERAITAYDEAAGIRRRMGLDKDLSSTLKNLAEDGTTHTEMGIDPTENRERA
ncbi:MAG: hypothetical protein P5691_26570, partial [Limnospira sp. PMC 1293.21]|nr:hypothetical protein [Limnospira sp. PMC 1293.21]